MTPGSTTALVILAALADQGAPAELVKEGSVPLVPSAGAIVSTPSSLIDHATFSPQVPDAIGSAPFTGEGAGSSAMLEVDGGVNAKTAAACVNSGADVLVAGTACFGANDSRAFIESVKKL